LSITGPYVHAIDPIVGTVFGVHLWWYGLSYSLGFLNLHLFVKRRREQLGLSLRDVYALTLFVTVGILLGGRLVEVVFYEWPFYSAHPHLIPAYWLGGMATHGLLFGAIAGVLLFARLYNVPFLAVTDELSVPGAFILGVGRLGNFIDGQIVGSVTDVWWAVKFPDAEGFRHPVVLYDGMKNLLLIPVLLYALRREAPRGFVTGLFLFLYAFLRIFIDVFRVYPTTLMGLATGQGLNIVMAALGLALMVWSHHRHAVLFAHRAIDAFAAGGAAGLWWQKAAFVLVVVFGATLPSDWTQDVPARYGSRHTPLEHSMLYPRIETAAQTLPRVSAQPLEHGYPRPAPVR
jgi:phosphatidylglycerol:prolipoprotein diacylglycerol transferase